MGSLPMAQQRNVITAQSRNRRGRCPALVLSIQNFLRQTDLFYNIFNRHLKLILYQLTAHSVSNTDSSGDIDSIIDGLYLP